MDLSYHIVGGDGQTYGPVPLDQMRNWVGEGRVAAGTQVFRSDHTEWKTAAEFPELDLEVVAAAQAGPATAKPVRVVAVPVARAAPSAGTPGVGTSANARPAVAAAAEALVPVIKSGAGWFYWIAGLSLVNTLVAMGGSNSGFVIGLGITQVFDTIAAGIAEESGDGGARVVALVLDMIVYGLLVMFGVFAARRHLWAFLVGMTLYALDAAIFVIVGDWLAVAFHALALFFMFKGLAACREYRRLTT